jgi:hypothetical protein
MQLTQFKLKAGKVDALGEFEGNINSNKLIIFSHGFGVKRDSKKMFYEMGDLLKRDYLVLRFDYNKINNEYVEVYPYTIQSMILNSVIEHINNKFKITKRFIIAHSMGCIIAALNIRKDIDKIILNAAPLTSPYKKIKNDFTKKQNAYLDEKGISRIERTDGSWTQFGSKFWEELKGVNPLKLYKKYSKSAKVYLVHALQDHVIGIEDYSEVSSIKNINYIKLNGDHNFSGKDRQGWLKKNVEIIKSK